MLTSTKPASASHHDLRHTPNNATGNTLGFIGISAAGHRYSVARASAATPNRTGLPTTIVSGVARQARQIATNGHTIGSGRSRRVTQATTTAGMAHYSAAGRIVNGAKRRIAFGG